MLQTPNAFIVPVNDLLDTPQLQVRLKELTEPVMYDKPEIGV